VKLDRGRWVLYLGILIHLLFVASLFHGFLNPLFIEAVSGVGQGGDYFGIYRAGNNLVHGISIYDPDPSGDPEFHRVPYSYFYRYLPPTAYVAAVSAILLPPWTAYVLWVVITELLLCAVVFWILRLKHYPLRERRHHAGLWLGFFPFYLEQWMGQFSFLMAVFLWIVLRAEMRDRAESAPPMRSAGAPFWAWVASVALKSYTALFAFTYLRRRTIRPVVLCAGLVALASLPYFLIHREDLRLFYEMNLGRRWPIIHPGTLGATAFLRLLGWKLLPDELAGHLLDFRVFDVFVGNVPVLCVNAFVVGCSLWLVLRHGNRTSLDLQLGMWILTFFLVFEHIWEYHYVMLLPVVTALGLSYGSLFVFSMGVLLALPTPFALFARTDHTLPFAADLVEHGVKAVPTYALFAWTVLRSIRHARKPLRAGG
jgi:hypothetical protein